MNCTREDNLRPTQKDAFRFETPPLANCTFRSVLLCSVTLVLRFAIDLVVYPAPTSKVVPLTHNEHTNIEYPNVLPPYHYQYPIPSYLILYHIQCTTDHELQLNSQVLQLCSYCTYIMMHLLITHKSRSLIHDHPAHQKLELEFQIPQTFSRILHLHQITSQSTLHKCIRTPRPSRGNVYPGWVGWMWHMIEALRK